MNIEHIFKIQEGGKTEFLEKYYFLRNKYEEYEKELNSRVKESDLKEIEVEGYCQVCGEYSKFKLDLKWGDGINVNFRERVLCPKCKLNMRMRYGVSYLIDNYIEGKKIYMYEKITSQYKAVATRIGEKNVVGSEYFGKQYESGNIINGILHEDAMNLSFEDETFDLIMSNDVFEHVADYRSALSESSRVLKTGGKMFLSIPFDIRKDETEIRAKITDGNLVNIKDPIYHGNPFDRNGSLVFTDFGWDILDITRECGFTDICMILYYDVAKGYIGSGTYYFELTK